jgi:hypothetical protein
MTELNQELEKLDLKKSSKGSLSQSEHAKDQRRY